MYGARAQDKPIIKIPVMERVAGLTCSHDAQFCIAGTAQGSLFVWQVSLSLLCHRFDGG